MTELLHQIVLDKENERFIFIDGEGENKREYIYSKARIEGIIAHLEKSNLKDTAPYNLYKGLLEKLCSI